METKTTDVQNLQNLSEADTASSSTSIFSSIDLEDSSTLSTNIVEIYVDLIPDVLDEYLNCAKGRIIKSYFNNTNKLGHHQSSLANLIIEKEIDKIADLSKIKITSERLVYLAHSIEKHFPGEKANVFYVPYNSNTRCLATGKLWTSYNKFKQKIRASLSTNKSDESLEEHCDSNTDSKLEYLKTNVSPWDKIIEYWLHTCAVRNKRFFSSNSKKIIEYFEEFPALKSNKGILLLELDFKFIFKNEYKEFFETWHTINKKLISIARNKTGKKPEIEKILETGEAELTGLFLLPFLLNNNFSRKRDSQGAAIRLSKAECAEIFILQVPNVIELSEKREALRKKIYSIKETVQPFIIFVGQVNIKGLVDIDNHLYECDSPLQAVDLCFKAFHATNTTYPVGTEPIWTFIQKVIYKINTNYDKSFISVNNLIRELN